MKRAISTLALVAMGLVVATSFAAAQDKPAAAAGGQVTIQLQSVSDVSSSKFQEYRDVPKGFSMPFVNLFATTSKLDFNLSAFNVYQKDQRYNGWINTSWLDFGFDYNQVIHRMGNDAHLIYQESAPGVWSMPAALRQYYSDRVDATLPTTNRNYSFYHDLLASSFASAGTVDIDSLRKRGAYNFDFSKNLPFALNFTYTNERRDGYRGLGGPDIISGPVSPVVEVPETFNDLTQDYAIKFEYKLKQVGNVHAALTKNVYTNDLSSNKVDNPFRPSDLLYTPAITNPATPAFGGPGSVLITGMPDNDMLNTSVGALFKFAKQTRIAADVAMGRYNQNASFFPYTSNTTVLTGTGAPAYLTSSLQAPSFNGKIDTTTFNVWFSSRPIDNLAVRVSYRSWQLTNKTNRFVITGDTSGSPDRSWAAGDPPTAEQPYGHPTAINYDNSSKRFQASASYDIGALTLEGLYRSTSLTRSFREAETGKDRGYTLAALYHAKDWLDLRFSYDDANRSAEGSTVYGFQIDEAERRSKRTGLNVELTPKENMGVTFSYFRRDVTYPNRPDRVAVSGGLPVAGAAPIPGTPSGPLSGLYDSYSVDFEYAVSKRIDLTAFYQYEKDVNVMQWSTTNASTATPPYGLNNLWNHSGQDKTNTFGLNAAFQLVPDKAKLTFSVMDQNTNGFQDITANPTGTYAIGRTAYPQYLNPADVWDVNDWDDSHITTVVAQLDYNVGKAWTVTGGYWYEKYTMSDAWTSGTTMFPQATLIFTKPNFGNYTANVVYGKLSYRF
jgi:hypothetical protein